MKKAEKKEAGKSGEEPSSSSSSDSDSDSDSDSSSASDSEVNALKRKRSAVIDFEALNRHGYRGGLSVLKVPPPKVEEEQNWSWSNGKDTGENKEKDAGESFEERQRTIAALKEGEMLMNVKTRREKEIDWEKEREKKNLSFSQKEKRKRDLGQASRGKNYVEEEKRLLRDNGVYSGFDS